MAHSEHHRGYRSGWLRAAVLGANDGLISTSSLVVGIASAQPSHDAIVLAAAAGLVAGSLSMAAGEYVSVSSQSDSENADLARERRELQTSPEIEHAELAGIYRARGLTPELALQVADQLTAKDALAAHARDELGLSPHSRARPVQAALASATAFAVGASPPLLTSVLVVGAALTPTVIVGTLVLLMVLGAIGAQLGGAPLLRATARVTFWGAIAMGCTALIGRLFGAAG